MRSAAGVRWRRTSRESGATGDLLRSRGDCGRVARYSLPRARALLPLRARRRLNVKRNPVVDAEPSASANERVMETLRDRAFTAMERAYAPYSNFRVGAALLGSDGSIWDG